MNLELKSDPKTWKQAFLALKTIDDLAKLLEVDRMTLIYWAYRRDKRFSYKEFYLKKRTGGRRKILAPISHLKVVQSKLSNVSYEVYPNKNFVHGFVRRKGIVTNSSLHAGKKLVFNIDLEDFFQSINFGRVRGLFMAYPYKFSPKVATLLANICCYQNHLPQGAPTSPIISNFICFRIDEELSLLAKKNRAVYTRYADDITFSTRANIFSTDIVKTESVAQVGNVLRDILEKNGFNVNTQKTRLQERCFRQEVTGLVVNEKVNVKRSYIREVRAILCNWKKHGLAHVEKIYYSKHPKQRAAFNKDVSFNRIVLGKINFIKSVVGQQSPVYRRLINAYNDVLKNKIPLLPLDSIQIINQNIWLVEVEGKANGTGFFMREVGFITCAHVVNLSYKIKIYKETDPETKYDVSVVHKNTIADLAILEISGFPNWKGSAFERAKNKPKDSELLTGFGFPLKFHGKEPLHYDCKIAGFRDRMHHPHLIIDRPIYVGMSGGPLLNSANEVVGVLVIGSENVSDSHEVVGNGAVPIDCVDQIERLQH